MGNKLKQAMERNRRAAEELDVALRDCLGAIRCRPDTVPHTVPHTGPHTVVEGRFRVIRGGGNRVAEPRVGTAR